MSYMFWIRYSPSRPVDVYSYHLEFDERASYGPEHGEPGFPFNHTGFSFFRGGWVFHTLSMLNGKVNMPSTSP